MATPPARIIKPPPPTEISSFAIGMAKVDVMACFKKLEFYGISIIDPDFKQFFREKFDGLHEVIKLQDAVTSAVDKV